MKTFVSCPFWLSGVLNNEIKKLGIKTFDTFEAGTYADTDWEWIYKINFWSRIANKVFIVLDEEKIFDFDELFELVKKLDWGKYIKHIWQISISVKSKNSKLDSIRTIQSISHKAIIEKLKDDNIIWNISTNMWFTWNTKVEIYIHLDGNKCQVMLNTSGESLHKRWYRAETWEAPIKENLAAGLILMSGWRFKDLLVDPFCGSWTILIEACMIAKNIAPGKFRNFSFEHFPIFDKTLLGKIREEAKQKEFDWDYKIKGFDIDPQMIQIAKENIHKAHLDDFIQVEVWDFLEIDFSTFEWDKRFITNPPYGKRITLQDMEWVYEKLKTHIYDNKWWFISGFAQLLEDKELKTWTKKNLYNGADECRFWKK